MHPGEVLREEFLVPLPSALLKRSAVSAGMPIFSSAMRSMRVRGTSIFRTSAPADSTTPQLWLNLQTDYDLQMPLRALGKAKIEPVAEAASS